MRWGRVWCSRVCGIDDAFVWGGPSSVPAAVAALLPDAGVMFGLVARGAEIREHVGPETLIVGAHETRQVVAGLDLQLDNSQRLRPCHGGPRPAACLSLDSEPGASAGGDQPHQPLSENNINNTR